MTSITPIPVAIAILYREGKYLLQLRDNIPNIAYPGCWGLFGGHVEPKEDPDVAVVRELAEEISYVATDIHYFDRYEDDRVIRHVYQAPLKVGIDQLKLLEGWDMGLISLEEIQRGECYSPIADQVRPIGSTHRQILLKFAQRFPETTIVG